MRLLLTSFVTVILMGLPINALSQNRTKKSVLTNKDKSEILVGVITDSLNELMRDRSFDQCTIPIVNGKKILLINTNLSIKPSFDIGVYTFRVTSREKIESEIKDNN